MFEAMLDAFPNLYLDTTMAISGYFPNAADVEMLRRRPDRILYGTDYPNLPYEWEPGAESHPLAEAARGGRGAHPGRKRGEALRARIARVGRLSSGREVVYISERR